jgi:hypothetical protein
LLLQQFLLLLLFLKFKARETRGGVDDAAGGILRLLFVFSPLQLF